jgi:hypothetical protein
MSEAHIEEHSVDFITFLGEQDGPIERLLKQDLIILFHDDPDVVGAYLARVQTPGTPSYGVALCIRSGASPRRSLVERVRNIFARLFSTPAHLDILFLSSEQCDEVARVCLPFYGRR